MKQNNEQIVIIYIIDTKNLNENYDSSALLLFYYLFVIVEFKLI